MLKNATLFIFFAIITLLNGNLAISSEDELKITVNQERKKGLEKKLSVILLR